MVEFTSIVTPPMTYYQLCVWVFIRGGQEVEVWKQTVGHQMKDASGKLIVRAGEQITKIQPLKTTASAA
jgi:hypothetical protein